MTANPLLSTTAWPSFPDILPEHVGPAVESAIKAHAATIAAIRALDHPDFSGAYLAKELADVRLNWVWGPAQHLEAVANSPELRDACQAARARLTAYRTGVGQDAALFAAIASVEQLSEGLSAAQGRALTLAARGFRLSGVALSEADQRRFAEIQVELGRLSTAFSNAVLDATDAWTRPVAETALAGLPEAERAILAAAAKTRGQEGWLITLQMPAVQAVMTYAEDRALRAEIYRAYQTRASDQGPDAGRFDNSDRIADILALRREAAQLLGFGNYAERSLFVKMAPDVAAVRAFLVDLGHRARPFAEAELAELRSFAADIGIDELEAWDVAYVSEKLRQAHYAIDQAALRQYFTLPKVLNGLFALVETLYGVAIVEQPDVATWAPDVRYFALLRDGVPIAGFYLDPFARSGKRGGAWMGPCRPRLGKDQGDVPAISYVVCNFAAPATGEQALLTHGEVVTLFHEMGHCLHHLLSDITLPSIAGISGFEWDAVEWPSQLMESFAWEPAILSSVSAHVDSGAPLPAKMIERLGRARRFQSGLALLRQVEYSLFDLQLHLEDAPDRDSANRVLEKVRGEIAVLRPPAWTRFPCAFTHVFAGGYAAGYYSYLWAERLAADAFEAFVGDGAIDTDAAETFRREVLAMGAARPALESFLAFRGRLPENEPLLRRRGLN